PFLTFAWMALTPPDNAGEDWKNKVSANLMTKALRGEALDFLVMLKEQADVSDAKNLKTKEARGNYVFEKLKRNAATYQKNIIALLEAENATYQSFKIINALHVKGDFSLLKKIAQLPEVLQLSDNSPVQLEEVKEETPQTNERGPTSIEWGIDMIDAELVWAMGINGQGVIVGGQDTGYDWTHPALSQKYRGNQGVAPDHNYNWHDAIHEINAGNTGTNPCGLDSPFPCDDNSHGTHTMGTMVGEDGDNQIGVAPGAKWIACRNMERGDGTPATYIECFEWFMAPTDLNNENPDVSKSPHVINNSWHCPVEEGCDASNWDMMNLVIQNLKASGVVVVFSAGNTPGCETITNPAMFEASFTIGATASNDSIAGFSSRGSVTVDGSDLMKPNVSAPGVNVRSCFPDSSYATISGTSMAAPHTTGMVALLISANPDLAGHVEIIEDIIEQTAVPKTDTMDCGGISSQQVPNNIYGYGRINALAAVNAALAWTSTDDNNLEKISVDVFPNPTDGLVSFEIKNLQGSTRIDIFDVAGHLILSRDWNLQEFQIKTLDLTVFASGIYFYKIKNEEVEMTGKILKK
ncbi:MAG TPA: T9SS type A sorting domain-containing protein, partial [Phaeodactylibacter sp.]|nr:T9SS type A sorting domain-containing protein [Phaeodactylibacter sp.]